METQVWNHHVLPHVEMSRNSPPSFHILVFLHFFVLSCPQFLVVSRTWEEWVCFIFTTN